MKKLTLAISILGLTCATLFGGVESMDTPWKTPPKRLNLESYIGTLYYYADNFQNYFKLENMGKSPKGLPIYLCTMTDTSIPDDDKNVILITALHSGAERTATAGLLDFTEWLMGGSKEAKESLQKNVILMMPVVSPEGFFLDEALWNSRRLDPYSLGRGNRVNLKTLELKKPEDGPEHIIFQQVSDKYKPDFHMDVHGTGLHFNAYIQPMTIGRAGSNSTIGPWDHKLSQALMASGPQNGFGTGNMEMCQRLIWGPAMEPHYQSFFDMGQPYYYGAIYGYIRNHTMLSLIESTWNFSVTEPLKALLAEANKGFSTHRINDFKVNVIKGGISTSLVSYGKTKAERRESRVNLWRKQDYFAVGTSYPNTGNFIVSMVAYGKEGLTTLTGAPDSGRWGQATFEAILQNTKNYDYINTDGLAKFFKFAPPNVKKIMFEKGTPPKDVKEPELNGGLGVMYSIPVVNAEVLEVNLNGNVIKPSTTDGYEIWTEDGFTHVLVNIPPEKTAKEKLYLVGIAWNTDRDIHSEYGYLPNAVIQNYIKNNLNDKAKFEIKDAVEVQTKHIQEKRQNK